MPEPEISLPTADLLYPGEKVYIIDDDPGIRGQLKWAFDDLDCTLCADRPSAIKAVRKEAPAVVLLDLGLPP
ncbi:MAG: hypothetical protein RQ753_08445, partial [Desulfurivibrionaceae bacterium]|nr:hypothetical protein [Desulfurivibrionaceae bacterium]